MNILMEKGPARHSYIWLFAATTPNDIFGRNFPFVESVYSDDASLFAICTKMHISKDESLH